MSTIYRHLSWLDEQEALKRREGRRAAEQRFGVNKGSIPDAEWPLALVQVDHTLLPVIIVDEKHRKSIGRAWITLAIDVFSRACLGMYLSLDPPSAMSAGMCISHAMLDKGEWMARLGCGDIEWPFRGPIDVLHMDNAKEFRGKMLAVATREYHIDIHLRPVKQPRYGAHIERLMGTVSEELKELKGARCSCILISTNSGGRWSPEEESRYFTSRSGT
nr:transposase family protein [Ralstonia mannitolilytica]